MCAPAGDDAGEPALFLCLADASADLFAKPRLEDDRGRHIGRAFGGFEIRWDLEVLLLDDREYTCKIEVAALGLHPSFLDVHHAGFEDVRRFFARGSARDARRQQLENSLRHAALLQVQTSCVKTLRSRIDMAGDGIGAENVRRKRVELRRRVSEEVCEGDGRERVRVGV